jgi:hypothetical protein
VQRGVSFVVMDVEDWRHFLEEWSRSVLASPDAGDFDYAAKVDALENDHSESPAIVRALESLA